MSWAAEDWTAGLSGLVLKKVQELQVHNEKLIRERQQRQLQLDNSEAALHKQKQKVCSRDTHVFIFLHSRARHAVKGRHLIFNGIRTDAQTLSFIVSVRLLVRVYHA